MDFDKLLEEHGDTTLSHYGVRGMKWGIRGGRTIGGPNLQTLAIKGIQKGVAANRARRAMPSSKDHKTVKTLRKKPTRTLSNKQLETINKRLEMEKKMSQLKIDNAKLTKGNNAIKAILAVGTTLTAAYALSQTALGKAIIEGIKNR